MEGRGRRALLLNPVTQKLFLGSLPHSGVFRIVLCGTKSRTSLTDGSNRQIPAA